MFSSLSKLPALSAAVNCYVYWIIRQAAEQHIKILILDSSNFLDLQFFIYLNHPIGHFVADFSYLVFFSTFLDVSYLIALLSMSVRLFKLGY